MLTREAFNALLKTLEEPPEHVVFILATTDAHKLPDTIVSRTQRFHFKPADIENLISLLKKVAKEENITITPEAIKLLAEHSDGSFRDSLSLLDQARSYGPSIDVETIQQLLGLPPSEAINSLFSTIKSDDPGTLVRQLSDLYNQGFQAATIAKQLAQLIRSDIVLNKSKSDVPSQLELLGKLVDVPPAYDPERFLEIVLLQAVTANPIQETEQLNQVANTTTSDEPVNPTPQKPQTVIAKKDKNKPINNDDLWPAVLHALKQKHNTLYGIVRMAKATITSDDSLQLTFSFAFHQKRLKESANRQLLLDTLGELTGRNMSIEFLLEPTGTSKSSTPEIKTEIQADNNLSTISNIFSGAELLES
jgi:DNA polymerase-3 subunit gamma/tau